MPINKDEIKFSNGEKKIKVEEVFSEKSDRPTSTTGAGISRGVLMLTNRRLLFFSEEKTESLGRMVLKLIPSTAASMVIHGFAGELIGGVSDYAIDGINHIIEKRGEENNVERFLDNKDSFVIPVERIVTCEKFGNRFHYWIGIPAFKKRYVRIGILDNAQSKIDYYCIYCNNRELLSIVQPFNMY